MASARYANRFNIISAKIEALGKDSALFILCICVLLANRQGASVVEPVVPVRHHEPAVRDEI